MIKSISFDQNEIIQNIIDLYEPNGIECDPTYSKGNFYKTIAKPALKFDLLPQSEDVVQADCRNLPLASESVNSIMFDPPFICGSGPSVPGIIRGRFGFLRNAPLLWEMYKDSLTEFYRILAPSGVLIFKCQDTIDSGKQYLSHVKIITEAAKLGFYPKDLFVLLAKNRLVSPGQRVQQHCREFHSYFLVFIKERSKVDYS